MLVATIVITLSEYSPEAALYTVKLLAMSVELIITFGNKAIKNDAGYKYND